jgi:hypothetical protein
LRRSRYLTRAIALVVATHVSAASAGVLYTTDLDAVGLGQAGAYVAAPETAAAVWYNPSGLAAQRGLRVALEGGLIRSPLSGQLAPSMAGAAPVSFDNQHPLLPAGLAGVSWDFGLRDLTAGLFAYVPSSSTYKYDPQGPQRFQGVGATTSWPSSIQRWHTDWRASSRWAWRSVRPTSTPDRPTA